MNRDLELTFYKRVKLSLRSFGDPNDHDFIQSQPAGSNCFETKQCQNLKQYNHDCFDCQRNARSVSCPNQLIKVSTLRCQKVNRNIKFDREKSTLASSIRKKTKNFSSGFV